MPDRRVMLLALGLVAASSLFLLWNLRGPVAYILDLRAEKLAVLVLVGASAGASTVVFQTVAMNRLLTPGIVGFDALFVFLQTMLVMGMGSAQMLALPPVPKFVVEAALMTGLAVALFGLILRKGAGDVIRMILTGVIIGTLLRALAGFAQRLLDPSEFAVLQQASVASFNALDDRLIGIAAVLLGLAFVLCLRLAGRLDVAALGRDKARTLGLRYDRFVLLALCVVSVMVAVSTALVGPVVFLGLLAASLAQATLRDHRHAVLIPAAALIGALILVVGQTAFERLFGLQSSLAIVVEFAGGLVFLALVLRRPT
ncbi:iron chelate uptake ABC transporter family permease subunit [Tropicibacter naphthalenivorans]|uniref:Hemin transport system permease protein HmuU n=1 Tax=Tropicibacter naphthalenivorans TaxID=441103 RepID=A0A0N7M181_9RHOB|nr:iron chelate uptake ABC transporter family permease subunit [Tropicibacter naphthalenivorans]CUH82529.1 Hemin transport system permease protein HmuU [Tropicibacter naphthalenivorans]SMD10596.1 iron complex transport system permease protein [Tropicibacter naphthalenivorans]